MDKVWAVKKIWRERIKGMELTPFQESMLQCGLQEFHNVEDCILGCVDVPISLTLAMVGECFEKSNQDLWVQCKYMEDKIKELTATHHEDQWVL